MLTLHSIPPEGEIESRQIAEAPSPDAFRKFFGGAPIEYVSVLYKDQPTTMVVDEVGAITFGERPPLPANARATEIYWAARKRRGDVPDDSWPKIHGPALVVEGWWHKNSGI